MPTSKAPKKKETPKSAAVVVPSAAQKKDKSSSRRKTGSSKSKSGGGIVDDVKALAVPFAILLAKQGLDSVFEKKQKSTSEASPEKVKSGKRRATMAGGQCNMCASASSTVIPAMTGGSVATKKHNDLSKKFNNIAKEIESFLNKY